MLTPWGYEVSSLPDIMTLEEFNEATGNAFATNAALPLALSAASAAIRNHCGWHVAPALTCTATVYGGGRVLDLPWMGMTAVASVTEEGTVLDPSRYDWRAEGLIRRRDGFYWPERWGSVVVTATAGYTADAILKQVIAQLVGNAIAAPAGVREEHAGDVGISYNAADGIAGGLTLTARDAACLTTYKIEGVA